MEPPSKRLQRTALWGVLSGRTPDGKLASYWVYKSGGTLSIAGRTGVNHSCHPSIRTRDDLAKEVLRVFQAEVVGFTPLSALGESGQNGSF